VTTKAPMYEGEAETVLKTADRLLCMQGPGGIYRWNPTSRCFEVRFFTREGTYSQRWIPLISLPPGSYEFIEDD